MTIPEHPPSRRSEGTICDRRLATEGDWRPGQRGVDRPTSAPSRSLGKTRTLLWQRELSGIRNCCRISGVATAGAPSRYCPVTFLESTGWGVTLVPVRAWVRYATFPLPSHVYSMRNHCYLASDAIVAQAIQAGFHPLDRTHTSRRPRWPASAPPRRSSSPHVGRVGREPLCEAHARHGTRAGGTGASPSGPERQERGQKRQRLMPVILAARVRVVRLLGDHARPQDAHACEHVAGAALGPLTRTRLAGQRPAPSANISGSPSTPPLPRTRTAWS